MASNFLQTAGHLTSMLGAMNADTSVYSPALQAPPSVGGGLTPQQTEGMSLSYERFNKLRKMGIAGKLMSGPSQVVAQMSQNLHMQQRGMENQFLAGTGQKKDQTIGGAQASALGGVAGGRAKLKTATAQQKKAQLNAQFEGGSQGLQGVNRTLIADSDARYQQAVAEAQHAQMVENERARVETAENQKKAAKSGAMMGGIGSIAGMAAGVALTIATAGAAAPVTMGMMAQGAAIGGALGGAGGTMAGQFL
jgi:hypothetical protein